MGDVDPAFVGAGRKAGIELWRIENKVPVKMPCTAKFHVGDSYLLLKTNASKSGGLTWNLHFWLGSESSQDEIGIAAYKTVELDQYLGDGPVQYREVQGHESELFMSYFKDSGVEYLPGGVASGFVKVDRDHFETRLLQLKGKRTVRATAVPVSASSLNTGDSFILDAGMKLYLWNGPDANRYEKAKGAALCQKIKDEERGGKAHVTFVDEDPNNSEFWAALGGQIKVTNSGVNDAEYEKSAKEATRLFHVTDASGSLAVNEVATDNGKLTRNLLQTNDVFILDLGATIFVWIGKGSNSVERKEGMMLAQRYLEQTGKPMHTPVVRIVEGAETPAFKGEFFQWDPPRPPSAFGSRESKGIAKNAEQHEIDVTALAQAKAETESMADNGSGQKQIWRIEDFKKVVVPEDLYGQFYGGDSYIILYTYKKGNSEEYIIYFWQGRDSSQDEKGASALLATELDDSMGGKPVQVRVVQGKEPAHFRQMFKGEMIVHSGGKASGFKNKQDADSYDTDGISLFHVKGSTDLDTYAVQVEEKARSLNSGDCFVLLTPSTMYEWQGSASSSDEKAVASKCSSILQGDRGVAVVAEGEEPDEFWEALGGKGEYSQFRAEELSCKPPRLFQCTNVTGVFDVTEVHNFTQEDLIDDDVMLLDTFTSVMLWIGSQANETEKNSALKTAAAYIKGANDGRDDDCSLMVIKAGSEPPLFSMHFLGWDAELFNKNKFVDPYEKRLAAMKASNPKAVENAAPAPAPAPAPVVASFTGTKTLAELQAGCDGIDITQKQKYLSDAEFLTVFKMDKAAFEAMPGWKKQAAKKQAGLF
jgi:hypothetical protein